MAPNPLFLPLYAFDSVKKKAEQQSSSDIITHQKSFASLGRRYEKPPYVENNQTRQI